MHSEARLPFILGLIISIGNWGETSYQTSENWTNLLVFGLAITALISCQTAKGLSRDFEGAGNGLQQVSNR